MLVLASAFVTNCNDALALVMLADAVADPSNTSCPAELVDADADMDADPSITKTPADVIDDVADVLALASLTISALDIVVAAVVAEPMASVIAPSTPNARTP